MATLVCFHAHPDDETITTGGTMARASGDGHRVVLVVATNGEHGEVPGDLAPGESLVDRRRAETAAAAAALGVHRIVWLGFEDSGMTGWEQNANAASFLQADVDAAAAKLADVLTEEQADLLTTYDWHGNYGHPDHVKVHHVGHRAAELAGTPRVLEATMNRTHIVRLMGEAKDRGEPIMEGGEEFDPMGPADDGNPFGMDESDITLAVDVAAYLDHKRSAIAAHRSQVTDTEFFLKMPDDVFATSFGTEWFIELGVDADGPRGVDLPLSPVRSYLVRHGRAAAGWDDDPDPPLEPVGCEQAAAVADALAALLPEGGAPVVTSPLRRCRETAAIVAEQWQRVPEVEPLVAEIPSPSGVPMGERVAWLRRAMAGRWADLDPRYAVYRDALVARIAALDETTIVVTHFVAINAVIGATLDDDRLLLRALDNCSVTIVEVGPDGLALIEAGREADTLIR